MTRISITIPEDTLKYVQDIAAASNRSVSNQITCLIKEVMEGDEAWQLENEVEVKRAL